MMANERKRDTHQKIQLGGLVVKAGLRDVEKAVILGALIKLVEDIEAGAASVETYRVAGDLAFRQDEEEVSL